MNDNKDDIKMRDYVDSRFDALLREIDKLAVTTEQRFGSVNELRGLANDISSRALPRTEFRQAHEALESKIDQIQKLVWIGLGLAIALQVLIGIAVIVWRRSVTGV